MEQLVEDTLEVTRCLQQRFNQEKIYLLGHSWGSTLGCLAFQKKPDAFHAFVGVGLVVSQRSLSEGRLAWITTEKMLPLLSSKDRNDLARKKPGDASAGSS